MWHKGLPSRTVRYDVCTWYSFASPGRRCFLIPALYICCLDTGSATIVIVMRQLFIFHTAEVSSRKNIWQCCIHMDDRRSTLHLPLIIVSWRWLRRAETELICGRLRIVCVKIYTCRQVGCLLFLVGLPISGFRRYSSYLVALHGRLIWTLRSWVLSTETIRIRI